VRAGINVSLIGVTISNHTRAALASLLVHVYDRYCTKFGMYRDECLPRVMPSLFPSSLSLMGGRSGTFWLVLGHEPGVE
jgi:hypothetical protein